MAEKTKSSRQSEEVILGKKFPGEKFSTVKSAAEAHADHEIAKVYADAENAIPITVYFSIRGHHDPVQQRMMEAYTKIRTATQEAFDEIFAKFFGTEIKEV